jgi:hypothetical protein
VAFAGNGDDDDVSFTESLFTELSILAVPGNFGNFWKFLEFLEFFLEILEMRNFF